MGIRGLFYYVLTRVDESVTILSVEEDIVNEIRSRREKTKILICCRSFFNYFKKYVLNSFFGGRHNMIQKEFEEFLGLLTAAGAELIFVFKKSVGNDQSNDEKRKIQVTNSKLNDALKFMTQLEEIEYTQDLSDFFSRNPCYSAAFEKDTGATLYQSAMKFGKFRGNDLLLIKGSTGHMMIAREVEAHAIIGLDTNYLCHEESCKLWFPESKQELTMGSSLNFDIKQFDKEQIRQHFQMSTEQFQLFFVLASQKTFRTVEDQNMLEKYFGWRDGRWAAMKTFILERVVFPLTQESIESMVSIIFGTPDPEIVRVIQKSLDVLGPAYHTTVVKYHDEEVNQLIIDDPYKLAEMILNKQSIYIESFFLTFNASDMQPLSTLVQPWIRRTMGMLLKHDKRPRTLYIKFQATVDERKKILLEAELPTFEVPPLKQLISGTITIEEKFKVLSFLIDNVLNAENLQQLPIKYLMHTIILVHLVKNDSLQAFEAQAFTKALKDVYDNNIPSALIYPEKVNVRAFRTSYLYEKMYIMLASCFASIGLKEFITGIAMDNVQYQIYFQSMINEEHSNDNIVEQLMNIIMQ